MLKVFVFIFSSLCFVLPLVGKAQDNVPSGSFPNATEENAGLEPYHSADEQGVYTDTLSGTNDISPKKASKLKAMAGKLVKVSGSINANTTFYGVDGIESRRLPFFYLISGNLNINVAGIDIPVSASVSTQSKEFAVPFNQFGLSPKYKSVTLHLGYRSLQYSRFTLSGSTFLGAGIDVQPKHLPLKVSAMYGRFEKASMEGSNMGMNFGRPSYERRGFAGRLYYGDKKKNLNFSILKAKDDPHSIVLPDSIVVRPEENLVFSLGTKSQILPFLQLEVEYALSSFTQDTRNQDLVLDRYTYANNIGAIFTPNATTEFNNALLANLNFKLKTTNLKVAYRRVDPNYRTIGAIFLNNDLEDVTVNVASVFLDNKLQASVGGGVQRNNLEEEKLAATKRMIGSVNLVFVPNDKLSLQLDFSNYNTSTETSRYYDLDSLDFYQITRNSGFSAQYGFGPAHITQSFFLQGSQQNVINSMDNSSVNQNINLGHQLFIKNLNTTVATTINYNRYNSGDLSLPSYGPGLVVSKSFLKKKLKTTFSATHLTSAQGSERQMQNMTFRCNNTIRLLKKHSFSLNASLTDRNSYVLNGKSFTEYRTVVNYGYTF